MPGKADRSKTRAACRPGAWLGVGGVLFLSGCQMVGWPGPQGPRPAVACFEVTDAAARQEIMARIAPRSGRPVSAIGGVARPSEHLWTHRTRVLDCGDTWHLVALTADGIATGETVIVDKVRLVVVAR